MKNGFLSNNAQTDTLYKNLIKSVSALFLLMAFLGCQTTQPDTRVTNYQADIQYLKDTLPVKHPNLFFYQSEDTFHRNLDLIASKTNLSSKDDAQILMQLREATAQLGDPHTNFGFYELLDEEGHFPIEIFWFEDGIWITGAAEKYQQAIGKQLVAINDIPMETVIEKVSKVVPKNAPYFSHKRMHYFLPMYAILNYYDITPTQTAKFTLASTDGTQEQVEISTVVGDYNVDLFKHVTPAPYYWLSVQGDSADLFRQHFFAEDGILLIQYNSCWSKELEERFGDAEDAKSLPSFNAFKAEVFEVLENQPVEKVIFDMRFNGGGSSPQGTQFIEELSGIEEINQKGKLFVAISQHTFSSAVINAMNFRQGTNAILLGAPSGGSPNHYGEVRTLTLPNTKMEIYHSTNYFKYIEEDLEAVVPDEMVPTRFLDIAKGVDPIYEYVKGY
ncbi:MAG: hypothetical protein AAF242_06385 [Bacteroidota bacterium]